MRDIDFHTLEKKVKELENRITVLEQPEGENNG